MSRRGTIILAALLLGLTLLSCGRRKGSSQSAQPERFPMVTIPSMIEDGAEATEYLAMHYWDDFTSVSRKKPCSDGIVSGVRNEDVEQAMANYLMILSNVTFHEALKSVSRLFDRIEACERADTSSTVFETMTELVSKYLYDPNSPLRNEDLYQPFVAKMAMSEYVDPLLRPGYENDARLCTLNSYGTPAADFIFSDRDGRSYRLYEIDAEYVLLFFSNPGCHACEEIIGVLSGSEEIVPLVKSGRLAVLNIYIDSDLGEWYKYMPIYPDDWYNGYDPNLVIRNDLIYNVRAIPSLYLLDSEKKVLMKDAPQERVFAFLSEKNL